MDGYVFPNEVNVVWTVMIVLYPYITGLVAGASSVSVGRKGHEGGGPKFERGTAVADRGERARNPELGIVVG